VFRGKAVKHFIVILAFAVTGLLCAPESLAMRSMEFLEKYDLSELTYVRMTSRECGFRKLRLAIILDSEGLPHTVQRGNYIGRHYGVVSQITPSYIKIEELHQDDAGEWRERTVVLPKEVDRGARTRFRYEQDRALRLLGEADESGKQLRERLVLCRQLYGKDAERLACFDAAVGTLF